MNTCPSTEQLRLLLVEEPSDPELLLAEAHVEACRSCQATLAYLTDADAAQTAPRATNGHPRAVLGEGAEFLQTLKQTPPPEDPSAHDPKASARAAPSDGGCVAPAVANDLPRVPGYALLTELGRGGMGVVYKARQVTLNRPVALKMILAGAHAGAVERDRFRREAAAVARLQHPHIVQIHEIGEHDGQPYLALELVEGGCLAQQLRSKPQPARRSAELVETLARAVHAAHECGIVHRDLKPANILLTASGAPKVTDFGLAKCLDTGPTGPTSSGQFLGTPSYMAPEQAVSSSGSHPGPGGTDLGPAADSYSLGAILYEMLAGRPPFRAETSLETVLQVLHDDPVPPSRLQPKLPRDLETICLTCLRKEPARRYPSALALAEDLRRFLAGEPILARPASAAERLWKWTRRRPASAALVVGALITIVFGFAAVAVLWRMAEARALLEARANRLAAAQTKLERAAKEAEANALQRAKRYNASLVVDGHLACCERGDVDRGMLGLAEALARSPAGTAHLQRDIRANLAAWRYRLVTHRFSLKHASPVRAVVYSPDGRALLTGSEDGTARLWDADTGAAMGPPLEDSPAVIAVALSPDGRIALTGGTDGTARLWKVLDGQLAGPPLRHEGEVRNVAFGPDGHVVLTAGSDGTARLWDAATGEALGTPMRHDAEILAAAFSPDGRTVLTGSRDNTARLWDVETGQPVGTPWRHEDAVQVVAFSPDGRRAATASLDGTVILSDPATGRPCHPPLRHAYPVWALAFSPDGSALLTGSGLPNQRTKAEARLWDTATGGPLGGAMPHVARVNCVAWSPNGRHILTGGDAWHLALWLAATDKPVLKMLRQEGPARAVAFSPDGRTFVSASHDAFGPTPRGEVQLFQMFPDQTAGPTLPCQSTLSAVAFSPDGRTILTGGQDGAARFWDAATGRPLGNPLMSRGRVYAVAFHPDGRTVMTGGSDRMARLWDAATGRPIGEPMPHSAQIRAAAFSPDGKTLATAGSFPSALLWDAATGRPSSVSLSYRDIVTAVSFSPDSRMILTGSRDTTARLWDADTGQPVGPPLQHRAQVRSVAYSPDGRTILTGCADMTARIWDAATRQPVPSPLIHSDAVSAAAFSPDGQTLATVCGDGSARLWNAATHKPIGAPLLHSVTALAFHPDGQILLTGGWQGTAQSWTVPRPLAGDAEQVLLWTKIVTGAELDANGVLRRLTPEAIQELRRRWEHKGAVPPL